METGDRRSEAGNTPRRLALLLFLEGTPASETPSCRKPFFPASCLRFPVSVCLFLFIQRIQVSGGNAHDFLDGGDATQYLGKAAHAQSAHAFLQGDVA